MACGEWVEVDSGFALERRSPLQNGNGGWAIWTTISISVRASECQHRQKKSIEPARNSKGINYTSHSRSAPPLRNNNSLLFHSNDGLWPNDLNRATENQHEQRNERRTNEEGIIKKQFRRQNWNEARKKNDKHEGRIHDTINNDHVDTATIGREWERERRYNNKIPIDGWDRNWDRDRDEMR